MASAHDDEYRDKERGLENARDSQQKRSSAMTTNRTILITGVTGKQGGAVAQVLTGAER